MTTCTVGIDIFSVSLFLPQLLLPPQQFPLRQSRRTMDAKKTTIETIKITTESTTIATRTITIGMATKTVPTVNIWARDTKIIGPLLRRNRKSKPRIGIGVTVIQITTDASR